MQLTENWGLVSLSSPRENTVDLVSENHFACLKAPFSDSMTNKQTSDNLAPSVVFPEEGSWLVVSILIFGVTFLSYCERTHGHSAWHWSLGTGPGETDENQLYEPLRMRTRPSGTPSELVSSLPYLTPEHLQNTFLKRYKGVMEPWWRQNKM